MVTAASPVRTPARAWIAGPERRGPRRPARAPARTARSASSSWPIGRAPDGHHRVADELLDRAAVAADRRRGRGRSSGPAARASPPASRPSASVVKPTRSAKRTETRRRSATGATTADAASPGRAVTAARRLQCQAGSRTRHRTSRQAALAAPQDGQASASRDAHSVQNLRPLRSSLPQFENNDAAATPNRWRRCESVSHLGPGPRTWPTPGVVLSLQDDRQLPALRRPRAAQ